MHPLLEAAFSSEPIASSDLGAIGKIPGGERFVEIQTEHGSVRFTGRAAGLQAQAWAEVYNNSPLFKTKFDAHMQKHGDYKYQSESRQDGEGGPHFDANVSPEEPGRTVTEMPNFDDPDVVNEWSSDPDAQKSKFHRTIVHEFAHQLIHAEQDEFGSAVDQPGSSFTGGIDANDSHGRGQTLFIGEVLHEMGESGIDVGDPGRVETNDISDNARIFGSSENDYDADANDYTELREEYSDEYKAITSALNESPPNYEKAEGILNSVDEKASFTRAFDGSLQDAATIAETVNVKDLMIQELMLEGGRSHIYGEGITPVNDKSAVGGFMSHLASNGDAEQAAELDSLAEGVRVPLSDLPG